MGKLEPTFRSEKYTVIQKSGSDVVVLSADGIKYRRPVAHLRKWPISQGQDDLPQLPLIPISDDQVDSPQVPAPVNPGSRRATANRKERDAELQEAPPAKRPKRSIKMPARYDVQ
nr:uncharacterized protein LOC115264774 [Aedes albopictus]